MGAKSRNKNRGHPTVDHQPKRPLSPTPAPASTSLLDSFKSPPLVRVPVTTKPRTLPSISSASTNADLAASLFVAASTIQPTSNSDVIDVDMDSKSSRTASPTGSTNSTARPSFSSPDASQQPVDRSGVSHTDQSTATWAATPSNNPESKRTLVIHSYHASFRLIDLPGETDLEKLDAVRDLCQSKLSTQYRDVFIRTQRRPAGLTMEQLTQWESTHPRLVSVVFASEQDRDLFASQTHQFGHTTLRPLLPHTRPPLDAVQQQPLSNQGVSVLLGGMPISTTRAAVESGLFAALGSNNFFTNPTNVDRGSRAVWAATITGANAQEQANKLIDFGRIIVGDYYCHVVPTLKHLNKKLAHERRRSMVLHGLGHDTSDRSLHFLIKDIPGAQYGSVLFSRSGRLLDRATVIFSSPELAADALRITVMDGRRQLSWNSLRRPFCPTCHTTDHSYNTCPNILRFRQRAAIISTANLSTSTSSSLVARDALPPTAQWAGARHSLPRKPTICTQAGATTQSTPALAPDTPRISSLESRLDFLEQENAQLRAENKQLTDMIDNESTSSEHRISRLEDSLNAIRRTFSTISAKFNLWSLEEGMIDDWCKQANSALHAIERLLNTLAEDFGGYLEPAE